MTAPPPDAPPHPARSRDRRPRSAHRCVSGSGIFCRTPWAGSNAPTLPSTGNPFWAGKCLVPAGAVVALLVSASVVYVLTQKQEAARIAAEQKSQAASTVPVVREAVFADFSIDLKDAQGRYRFLQCDVTIEFQSEVTLTEDRKVEIRKIIYMSAKKKGPELIRVSDSGERFKKEMRGELRDLLGEGALKDVYITRYVLI
ncbi:MAG: flagellar basal body-associated FliL family protein [Desulfobacterales bacterium]|nr:flagellar basal body-associated FliL family protein [Desulfobacterales bacterium]